MTQSDCGERSSIVWSRNVIPGAGRGTNPKAVAKAWMKCMCRVIVSLEEDSVSRVGEQ
jgi:hypothetical protein